MTDETHESCETCKLRVVSLELLVEREFVRKEDFKEWHRQLEDKVNLLVSAQESRIKWMVMAIIAVMASIVTGAVEFFRKS